MGGCQGDEEVHFLFVLDEVFHACADDHTAQAVPEEVYAFEVEGAVLDEALHLFCEFLAQSLDIPIGIIF